MFNSIKVVLDWGMSLTKIYSIRKSEHIVHKEDVIYNKNLAIYKMS